jgi:hypothetical protein
MESSGAAVGHKCLLEPPSLVQPFTASDVRFVVGQVFPPSHIRCCSFSSEIVDAVEAEDRQKLRLLVADLLATGPSSATKAVVPVSMLRVPSSRTSSEITATFGFSVTVARRGAEGTEQDECDDGPLLFPPFLVVVFSLKSDSDNVIGGLSFTEPSPVLVPLTSISNGSAKYHIDARAASSHRTVTISLPSDVAEPPQRLLSGVVNIVASIHMPSDTVSCSMFFRIRADVIKMEKRALEQHFFGLLRETTFVGQHHAGQTLLSHISSQAFSDTVGNNCGQCLFQAQQELLLSCCAKPMLVSTRNVIPVEARRPKKRSRDSAEDSSGSLWCLVSKCLLLSMLLDQLQ